MSLGEVVRYCRERSGMSARNLSKEAGLSDSYVSKLEAGDIRPNLEAFSRIARCLKLSEREILFIVYMMGDV